MRVLTAGAFWMVVAAAALAMTPAASAVDVTVDADKRYQVIEGFGTCTINWMPNVSALYDTQKFRDFYADDLGGSIVRFHLAPDLQPEPDLDLDNLDLAKFNWDAEDLRHAAEFAKAIYLRDPKRNKIITSIWSPPAWMKTNNELRNGGHIRPDRFDHLAKYIVGISRSFEAKFGVPLYAISIQNELSFEEPYDSCQYTVEEFHQACTAIAKARQKWPIDTRVMGPEQMGQWVEGTSPPGVLDYLRPVLADPVASKAIDIIDVHGYGGDGVSSAGDNPNDARVLREKCAPFGREIWMTETSGEQPVWVPAPPPPPAEGAAAPARGARRGRGPRGPQPGALALAWKIHNGLVNAGNSAWVYWQILDPTPSQYALCAMDQPTPKFYAAKQFFRFIRPGAYRVDVAPTDRRLAVSAFVHPEDRTLTVVLINLTKEAAPVSLSVKGAGVATMDAYRSSAAENCTQIGAVQSKDGAFSLEMPAESVVTLMGKASM
jgi:glucuronoarabinoxylan endo-1,4-beta-xylanase